MCYDAKSDGPSAGSEFKGYTTGGGEQPATTRPYAQPGKSEPQYRARRAAEQAKVPYDPYSTSTTLAELRRQHSRLQAQRESLTQKIDILGQLISLWEV